MGRPHLAAIVLAMFSLFVSTTILSNALPRAAERVGQVSATQDSRPANCRVTLPSDGRFTPPQPYPTEPDGKGVFSFWFGTENLWTVLPTDGKWTVSRLTGHLARPLARGTVFEHYPQE
jgi:hypothetical protein